MGIYTMSSNLVNSEILLIATGAIEPDWYPNSPEIIFARGSELWVQVLLRCLVE
jgi:hypothetical protein